MPIVVAGVVVVGILCLINLVLTFGVIRRLREHSALLTATPAGRPMDEPAVGSTVADFTARTVGGTLVGRESLAAETLVGFFSPGCAPCDELVPAFLAHAATVPGGREQVLAVLSSAGPDEPSSEVIARLGAVAQVVVEGSGPDTVTDAFGVRGFPTLCTVEVGGRITASGPSLRALLAPAGV